MCDAIELLFGVVSGVIPGIGVLDGVHVTQREREVFGGTFLSVGLNGTFECVPYMEAQGGKHVKNTKAWSKIR